MLNEIEVRQNIEENVSSAYSEQEKAAMLRAVIQLFAQWDISDAQASILLGGLSTKTLQRWRKGEIAKISLDQADRMSYFLGIHKALRSLFDDRTRVFGWIKKSNTVFQGLSALDVMLGGHMSDLSRVRRYLDASRSVW